MITQVEANGIQVSEARPKVVITMTSIKVMTDWDGEVLNKGKTYAEYVAYSRRMEQIRKYGHPLLPEQKEATT